LFYSRHVARAAKLSPGSKFEKVEGAVAETAMMAMAQATAAARMVQAAGEREVQWFAAYTCANHEKRVAAHLDARAVEHFLPVYRSLRRWKDRRAQIDLPLFAGYVFVRLALCARLRVLTVPGVVHLVGFGGRAYPLPAGEVEALRAGMACAANGGTRIEPHPYLRAGVRVRITGGPFAGADGILVRRKNAQRVVVSLDLIARSAAIEVGAADIERIL
jgi:transcription antitermination factor NusG